MIISAIQSWRTVFEKDRLLGQAVVGKYHYDLPLNKNAGAEFLLLLVALMTFLAVMALVGMFVLSGIGSRWASGLENKLTIEIPATDSAEQIRDVPDMTALQDRIQEMLKSRSDVESVTVLNRQDILELVSPWLGNSVLSEHMPLPGLISVELVEDHPKAVDEIRLVLHSLDPSIRLDAHETWLDDVLHLSRLLQGGALFVVLIIGLTTVTAVAGAVRARMAVHKDDVELLHLMGASDNYIMKQFQRHALIIALKGSCIGVVIGLTVLFFLGSFSGGHPDALFPEAELSLTQMAYLFLMPVLACLIAAFAARFTILRTLQAMP